MSLSDEKYISVETFRRTGEAVATPTWVVPLDGGLAGFWTSSRSGKAKRLRNNPAVTVTPCDARGRVEGGATKVSGTAVLTTSSPEFENIQARVRAKYGLMVHVSRVLNTLGHLRKGKFPYGDVGVVLQLDA